MKGPRRDIRRVVLDGMGLSEDAWRTVAFEHLDGLVEPFVGAPGEGVVEIEATFDPEHRPPRWEA